MVPLVPMPRPPRVQASETIYHLFTRGNRSAPIVRNDSDRETLMEIVGNVVERHELICIAYCLMTTHYHLLVQTRNDDLAAAMERLNGLYARSFNRAHRLRGHVFERRYWSVIVKGNPHLHAVCRYIALNPVEAGICALPDQWPWSSYPVVLGLAPAPRFFRPEPLLSYFDHDPDRAREVFKKYTEGDLGTTET